eukprot:TRINITY_DN4604_c0_g1_i1.p1 TRINITY_DN4604_c0_g1~~TRINITY_DN4604_c0_g1_i1.p1  ORF type:complete len:1635 (+),score=179.21 TRINITY_DN4604_c0_g1_i1:23-4927(+)
MILFLLFLLTLQQSSSSFTQWALLGHSSQVNVARFSPDGSSLLTTGEDGKVLIFDVITGSLVLDLQGHTASVRMAEFSLDNQWVATAGRDFSAFVFNANSGTVRARIDHSNSVVSIHFSLNSSFVLTASYDGKAVLFDIVNNQLVRTFEVLSTSLTGAVMNLQATIVALASFNQFVFILTSMGVPLFNISLPAPPSSLSFSPQGTELLVTYLNEALVLEIASQSILCRVQHGPLGQILSSVYSPDGSFIVTTGTDHSACVITRINTTCVLSHQLTGHSDDVVSATISSDGGRILTASKDKTAKVFDADTGTLLLTLSGHSKALVEASFSPDSFVVATAGSDNTAKLFDASTGHLIRILDGHTQNIRFGCFSHNGQFISTASADGFVILYSIHLGRVLHKLPGHSRGATVAAFSPDDQWLLTGDATGMIRLWTVDSGLLLQSFTVHTAWVTSAQFDSITAKFVTTSIDGSILIANPSTGAILKVLQCDAARNAVFLPGDTRILVANGNQSSIFDVDGKVISLLYGHTDLVRLAIVSQDGRFTATCSMDRSIRIYTITGDFIQSISTPDAVLKIAFSPDSTFILAIIQNSATPLLFDVATGMLVRQLSGHVSQVNDAVFSPDGNQVATASTDTQSKVFNVATGLALFTFQEHPSRVTHVAFHPNGSHVLSISDDVKAMLWSVRYIADVSGCAQVGFLLFNCSQLESLSCGADALLPATIRFKSYRSARFRGGLLPAGAGGTPLCSSDTSLSLVCTVVVPANTTGLWTLPTVSPLNPVFMFSTSAYLTVTIEGHGELRGVVDGRQAIACIAPNCTVASYPLVHEFTLTARPLPGMVFRQWIGCSTGTCACNTDSFCTVRPFNGMNINLTAGFSPAPGTLNVARSPPHGGALRGLDNATMLPVFECGQRCSAQLFWKITIVGEPEPGWFLRSWIDCPSGPNGDDGAQGKQCTVPAGLLDVNVQAVFALGNLGFLSNPVRVITTRNPNLGPIIVELQDPRGLRVALRDPLLLLIRVQPDPWAGPVNATTLLEESGRAVFTGLSVAGRFGEVYSLLVTESTGTLTSIKSLNFTMGNCQVQAYSNMTSWQCEPCAETVECPRECKRPGLLCNGSVVRTVVEGNWRCGRGSDFVYPCLGSCQGGSHSGTCLYGTAGIACGSCQEGFAQWTAGACSKCWPKGWHILFIVVTVLLTAAVFLWFVWKQTRPTPFAAEEYDIELDEVDGDYCHIDTKPSGSTVFTPASPAIETIKVVPSGQQIDGDTGVAVPLKLLVHFMQTTSQLRDLTSPMHWAVRVVFGISDVVRSGLVALPMTSCSLQLDALTRLILSTFMLPVGCVLGAIFLHFGIAKWLHRVHKRKTPPNAVLRSAGLQATVTVPSQWWFLSVFLMMLVLTSPFCVSLALPIFVCDEYRCGSINNYQSTWILRSDRVTVCEGTEYSRLIALAASALSFHGLFIPLVTAALVAVSRERNGVLPSRRVFQFFCAGYRNDCWWWEGALLGKKFLISVAVTFSSDPGLQVQLCTVVVIVHLFLMLYYRPFEQHERYQLEQRTSGILLLILALLGLFPFAQDTTLLLLNGMVLLLQIAAFALFAEAIHRGLRGRWGSWWRLWFQALNPNRAKVHVGSPNEKCEPFLARPTDEKEL